MIYSHKAVLIFFVMLLYGSSCLAIDNPDAPDFVNEFEARALKFETNLQSQGLKTSDTVRAYSEYEKFLDQELNQAYSALMKKIRHESRKNLMGSQKQWIHFRDAEFSFVADNWTTEKSGTSSIISIGASRTKIIRDRVIELLYYLKNY